MKLLCIVQHFRQGWGGAPESVRLLAQVLAGEGISVDVFDLGKLHRQVERLDLLPEPGEPCDPFDTSQLDEYDALLVAGPWQDWRHLRPVLKRRKEGQKSIYLPRGGLGRIEFARTRDIKKWPYFYLIERRIIDACSAIIFSSECERRHTIGQARGRTQEVIIPDFFDAPAPLAPEAGGTGERRFSFMAEIAPRKGLVPMVEAFCRFAARLDQSDQVRLTIAGSVRRGSEAYFETARERAKGAPANAAVEFVGPVAHGNRPQFYRDSDIFLVPSLFESYGLTVLEALSAGCAVLAGPQIGALEYLTNHERLGIATSVEPGDLAAALARLHGFAHDAQARQATSSYAASAIGQLNTAATERWKDLLGD